MGRPIRLGIPHLGPRPLAWTGGAGRARVARYFASLFATLAQNLCDPFLKPPPLLLIACMLHGREIALHFARFVAIELL